MAARPRSSRKRNWPDHLYERGGYYSWRSPIDGVEYGIGRVTFADACAQAIEANLHVRDAIGKPRLVDRLTGAADRTVDALVKVYNEKLDLRLAEADLSAHTVSGYKSHGNAVRRAWGSRPTHTIGTRDAAEFLDLWIKSDKMRMAQSLRSYLKDLFRYAEANGWIPRGTNPATITDRVTAKVKRARLSLDEFLTVYDAAKALDPWVRASMALAIVSAQRREDLAAAEFKEGKGSTTFVADRKLWVAQKKVAGSSGMRLRIPFELELAVVGITVESAIAQCRDSVLSKWLIHHSRPRTKSKPGDQVWIDTITKGFTRARNRTSLKWPEDKKPPTFHEIRSLSARLYEAQGNVDVQALLGHTDPETTAIYTDDRAPKWLDVLVG